MLPTLSTVSSAVQTAEVIAQRTPESLSKTARRLYTALIGTALEVMKERGYSINTTEVTFFAPAESVALAVGVHPSTVYRKLPELYSAGLVEARGHYVTYRNQTRSDGTLWAVRLTPTWGSSARVGFDYMKRSYRCLGADIETKRTAFAQMRESKENPKGEDIDLEQILPWALPPQNLENPVMFDSRTATRRDLESLLDVTSAPKNERNHMVQLAADALALALADQNSVNWYQKLLWQLLRRFDATGDDYSYQVYLMAQRAATDSREGFARRAGALFHSRLKQANWFEWITDAPPNRVGTKPKN